MTKGDVIDEIDVPCQTNRCQCMVLMAQPAFATPQQIIPASFVTPPGRQSPPADASPLGAPPWRIRTREVPTGRNWMT